MLLKKSTASALIHLTVVFGLPQATTSELPPTAETDIATVPEAPSVLATVSCPPGSSEDFERLTRLLPKVLDNAVSLSNKSWEIGTVTQSLLEVYDPHFAPFEWDASAYKGEQIPWRVLEITKTALATYDWTESPGQKGKWYELNQKDSEDKEDVKEDGGDMSWLKEYLDGDTARVPLENRGLVDGAGALGDPCSVGPAVWMLAQLAARKEVRDQGFKDPQDYAWAVGNQVQNLTSGPTPGNDSTQPNPEVYNGTYSQRNGYFELWADMGYMIPPFLAHLGLATNDSKFLDQALEQHALETSALINPDLHLFRHVNGDWDNKFWATGNGWMTYGLVRVIASIYAAGKQDQYQDRIDTRLGELGVTLTTLLDQLNVNSTLPNYMMEANETFAQGESAGTALVLAAFHRFEVLAPWLVTDDMKAKAEKGFGGVMKNLKEDGWLGQVVDPSGDNGFNVDPKAKSAEGQSFMGMLWAAKVASMHFEQKTQSITSGIVAAADSTSSA